MTNYALFYIHNDPDLDYGVDGGVTLIGLFSSKNKIYNWIKQEEKKPNINPEEFPELAEFLQATDNDKLFTSGPYNDYPHLSIIKVQTDHPKLRDLDYWSYEE